MRNTKAVNQVYDVLKAVYDLEKEMKAAPVHLAGANREECAKHLAEARHQLQRVLDEVYAADFRERSAAA
ncbi:hypothetical protein [Hyphomicrobium sp.]|uniref:hypothetical protein n=1 Tax=Hyphomicrobium sp. TaxID=82 RepID=UPI002D76899A|nr:hypothetical protein [Hyphomicrobium sp.]HET6390690.1 hypothetical protein [Hyphomicrobium sp.]